MYNVTESVKQNASDRENDDKEMCRDIIENSLGIRAEEYNIKKVIRLGKPRQDGKNQNRPVLIRLADEDEKWVVIKRAKQLKFEKTQ